MSIQLQVKSGANIENGLTVTGGLIVDGTPITGGGTVNVTAPLTGNGSSGTPLAISAATESAAGSMSAADKTKLDNLTVIDPGHVFTVTQDVTNIDLIVNSATDGGWEFWGFINQGSGGDADVYLQPNANTNALAVGYSTNSTLQSGSSPTTEVGAGPPAINKLFLGRAGGNANRAGFYFGGRFFYKDGVGGFFKCTSYTVNSSLAIAAGPAWDTSLFWQGTDANFTTLRINCATANGIKYNSGTNPSWIRWRSLGFTA